MPGGDTIRIGTRGSALALWQARFAAGALTALAPEIRPELVTFRTQGDVVQDRPISQFADKGAFVRTLENALLSREIDLAVHSLKDVPSDVEVPGLALVAFPQRADPRDALVSSGPGLLELPAGARIGTSSIRRRVQILALRPDLTVLDIRGNVDTRLRKLDEGEYDAVVLAAAGLIRLGLADRITEYLAPDRFMPDAGQGILAVQGREGDPVSRLAAGINLPDVELQARVERAVVREMGATCHSPVGALLSLEPGCPRLAAMAASEDGASIWRVEERVASDNIMPRAVELGRTLAGLVGGYG